ncbi:MAG: nucleotidyltransferase domain-containing protein [Methanocorpusculum sp.]|nr:nucleotidyltransferase domain-containing protein [Methanocorpusculum sp.]
MSEYVSIKEDVLKKLNENLSKIRERFDIETIGICGSVSRGEDTPDSDVDVLYSFTTGGLPLRRFFEFKKYLENLFGRDVDLIPVKWMAPELRPYIEQDMILCAASV